MKYSTCIKLNTYSFKYKEKKLIDDYHSRNVNKRIMGNKSSIFSIFQLGLLNNDHDIAILRQSVHVELLHGILLFIFFLSRYL